DGYPGAGRGGRRRGAGPSRRRLPEPPPRRPCHVPGHRCRGRPGPYRQRGSGPGPARWHTDGRGHPAGRGPRQRPRDPPPVRRRGRGRRAPGPGDPTVTPATMDGLLLVGHGSTSPRSAVETQVMAALVAAALPEVAVDVGFLEMTEPAAGPVLDRLAARGCT